MDKEMIVGNINMLEQEAAELQREINAAHEEINNAKLRFKTHGERISDEKFKSLRDIIRIKTIDMHSVFRKIRIEKDRLRGVRSENSSVAFKKAAKILLTEDMYNKISEYVESEQGVAMA